MRRNSLDARADDERTKGSPITSLFYQIKRHPIPITAFFRHSLVLTYALPQNLLRPLLPPGLTLDTFGEFGFLAIAMVQTEALRPAFLPRRLGQNFFLSGYRIFARFTTAAARKLRGLRILRSDTDSQLMASAGNLLTHYNYRRAEVYIAEQSDFLEIKVTSADGAADLHVIAKIDSPHQELPLTSPFPSLHEARLFAGPLPFTFDYESETHSIVIIEGVRQNWKPRLVPVDVLQNTFLEQEPFCDAPRILASAFHVQNIDYRWRRGVREKLSSHL